jgi:hypothetical protein
MTNLRHRISRLEANAPELRCASCRRKPEHITLPAYDLESYEYRQPSYPQPCPRCGFRQGVIEIVRVDDGRWR